MGKHSLESNSEAGMGVIEVLYSSFIMAALVVMGIPSLLELQDSFERHASKTQLEAVVLRARSQSLHTAARGVLLFTLDGSGYTFGHDYSPTNFPVQEDNVLFMGEFSENIAVSSSQPVLFNSQGFLVDENGELTNTTLTLRYHGKSFCRGNIFATGSVNFNCL